MTKLGPTYDQISNSLGPIQYDQPMYYLLFRIDISKIENVTSAVTSATSATDVTAACAATTKDVRQLEAATRHLPPNCTNFITYYQLYEFFYIAECMV